MGFAEQRRSPSALVGSYPTVSPLPSCLGGLLSAALSLTLRPVDVIDHLALRSPDFPLTPYGLPSRQRLPDLPLAKKYSRPQASRP